VPREHASAARDPGHFLPKYMLSGRQVEHFVVPRSTPGLEHFLTDCTGFRLRSRSRKRKWIGHLAYHFL